MPLWQLVLAYSSSIILFLGFCILMFYLRMLVSRLEEESQTDALTGLRSRRNFLTHGAVRDHAGDARLLSLYPGIDRPG